MLDLEGQGRLRIPEASSRDQQGLAMQLTQLQLGTFQVFAACWRLFLGLSQR